MRDDEQAAGARRPWGELRRSQPAAGLVAVHAAEARAPAAVPSAPRPAAFPTPCRRAWRSRPGGEPPAVAAGSSPAGPAGAGAGPPAREQATGAALARHSRGARRGGERASREAVARDASAWRGQGRRGAPAWSGDLAATGGAGSRERSAWCGERARRGQPPVEQSRVDRALVEVVGIHDEVDLGGLVGDRRDRGHPLVQFVRRVVVVEPLGRRRGTRFPRIAFRPWKRTNPRPRRDRGHRRHGGGGALRLVDADVCEVQVAQRRERAPRGAPRPSRARSETRRRRGTGQAARVPPQGSGASHAPGRTTSGTGRRTTPMRPASCSGSSASLNGDQQRSTKAAGASSRVELALPRQPGGRSSCIDFGSRCDGRRVLRAERVRLHVEGEARRRPLDPEPRVLVGRESVDRGRRPRRAGSARRSGAAAPRRFSPREGRSGRSRAAACPSTRRRR